MTTPASPNARISTSTISSASLPLTMPRASTVYSVASAVSSRDVPPDAAAANGKRSANDPRIPMDAENTPAGRRVRARRDHDAFQRSAPHASSANTVRTYSACSAAT